MSESENTPNLAYIPSLGGNVFYIVFFGVALVAQTFLGIRYRTWGFLGAMVGGLLLEIFGYIGRILMHNDVRSHDGFLMYLVSLTIAGAFFAAAIYLCLAHIVVVFGEHISRIKPRTYTVLFISFDFFSLLLQAVGGGIASSADTQSLSDIGVNVMLAGLSFQVFSLAVFIAMAGEFAWRAYKADHFDPLATELRRSKTFKLFLLNLAIATIALFVRSAFRVAELSQGYDGELANDEVTFMILEGAMIAISTISLTAFHPGASFKGQWASSDFKMRTKHVHFSGSSSSREAKNSGTLSPEEGEIGLETGQVPK
ncbi:MAG: hypothetical protein M1837_005264 [Sclerophora amabilis]|nr:MAG: hypothetical protein M1837_005264 [Sclerophora amabilis]